MWFSNLFSHLMSCHFILWWFSLLSRSFLVNSLYKLRKCMVMTSQPWLFQLCVPNFSKKHFMIKKNLEEWETWKFLVKKWGRKGYMFTKFQNTNEKYLECHYLIKPSTHKAKNKKNWRILKVYWQYLMWYFEKFISLHNQHLQIILTIHSYSKAWPLIYP